MSVERGVSTRVIWMSRAKWSWPTPTGNTGIDRALRLASGSSSVASDGVGAVGDHHQAGERQARQFVAGALERLAEMRGRAGVLQIARRGHAVGGGRKAEVAEHEPLRERLCERAVRAELLVDEVGARLLVAVRNRHAARVVNQHAEEVLLRDGGAQDQRRAEQAEQEKKEQQQADGDEHRALARGALRS